jgi:GNAT superfamily N-acetyltransferase
VLQVNIFEKEDETIELFEKAGYEKARTWSHYEINFNAPPPTQTLPNGMSIRLFDLDNDSDWELVGPAQDAAFMDHWGAYTLSPASQVVSDTSAENDVEPVLDFSYSNAPGYCFIAFIGEDIAGGILCNAKLVEYPSVGRVGSVFTHPKFRRRGVGRNLMLAAFNAFYQNGMRRVILDTDSGSFTDSAKFYTSLGMNIYRREFLYEKEIRAGEEIRRLAK